MATGLIAAEADSILGTLGAKYTWVKLHVGDPGASGTANPATETDRVQVTWGTPTGGTMSSSTDAVWSNVAANEDYTHFSVWDDPTGGACGFTGTITANPVTASDTFTIRAGDLTASFPVAS